VERGGGWEWCWGFEDCDGVVDDVGDLAMVDPGGLAWVFEWMLRCVALWVRLGT